MSERYEYRFSIDAFTPETLPISRLVEYLGDLAILLGYQKEVHFLRVDEGSAELVALIESTAQPKVQKRIAEVRSGFGPDDAQKAYKSIDDRLANDNSVGMLRENSTNVLEFPGRERKKPITYGPFNQSGTLNGVVISVGGRGDPVPVHLQDEDAVYNCLTSREIARKLARGIFTENVRVFGIGRWFRDADGNWVLRTFRISAFKWLNPAPLTEVVTRLREVHQKSDWVEVEDPIGELKESRSGSETSQK